MESNEKQELQNGFGSRWRTDFPEADAAAEITDSCRPVLRSNVVGWIGGYSSDRSLSLMMEN